MAPPLPPVPSFDLSGVRQAILTHGNESRKKETNNKLLAETGAQIEGIKQQMEVLQTNLAVAEEKMASLNAENQSIDDSLAPHVAHLVSEATKLSEDEFVRMINEPDAHLFRRWKAIAYPHLVAKPLVPRVVPKQMGDKIKDILKPAVVHFEGPDPLFEVEPSSKRQKTNVPDDHWLKNKFHPSPDRTSGSP